MQLKQFKASVRALCEPCVKGISKKLLPRSARPLTCRHRSLWYELLAELFGHLGLEPSVPTALFTNHATTQCHADNNVLVNGIYKTSTMMWAANPPKASLLYHSFIRC